MYRSFCTFLFLVGMVISLFAQEDDRNLFYFKSVRHQHATFSNGDHEAAYLFSTYTLSRNGKSEIITSLKADSSFLSKRINHYNKKGHRLEEIQFSSDPTNPSSRFLSRYNRFGELKSLEFFEKDSLSYRNSYKIQKANKKIRRTRIKEGKDVVEYQEKQFNKKKELISFQRYLPGEFDTMLQYEYDPQGRMIREQYFEDGNLMGEQIIEYDSFGKKNRVKEIHFNENGDVMNRFESTYSYNSRGLITEFRSFKNKELTTVVQYTYEYWD